jgi:hypothetical protein
MSETKSGSIFNRPLSKWLQVPLAILEALVLAVVWLYALVGIYRMTTDANAGSIVLGLFELFFAIFIFLFCAFVFVFELKNRWIIIACLFVISLGMFTFVFLS